MKKQIIPVILLAVFTILLAGAAQAKDTDLYWDINGATAGAGGATPAGTWDTTSTNKVWSKKVDGTGGGSNLVAWLTSGADNCAFFSAGSDATGIYTVSVSGIISVKNVTVEEGFVTLGGTGSFSLTNAATWSAALDQSLTVSGALNLNGNTLTIGGAGLLAFNGGITGSSTVTKSDVGAASIGSSSYTGATTVNDGTFLVNGTHTGGGDYAVTTNVANHNATLGGTGAIQLAAAKTVTLTGANGRLAVLAPGVGSTPGTLAITAPGANGVTFAGYSRLAIDINGANTDLLSVAGNLRLTSTTDELLINAVSPTAGKYTFLTYTALTSDSGAPGFSTVTGLPGYRFNSTATAFELIARPTLDITANPVDSTVISGASTNVDVTVWNTNVAGGDVLANFSVAGSAGVSSGPWSSSGALAANSSISRADGTFTFSSTTLGLNTGRLTVSTTDSYSTNASDFIDVIVDVVDHSAASLQVADGNSFTVIKGASGVTADLSLKNASGHRAHLDVNSLDSGVNGSTGAKLVAPNGSKSYTAAIDTNSLGAYSHEFKINVRDENLRGRGNALDVAALVTGNVLEHADASFDGLYNNDVLDVVWNIVPDTAAGRNFAIYNLDLPDFARAGLVFSNIAELSNPAGLFSVDGGFSGILAEGNGASGDTPFQVNFAGAGKGTYKASYQVNLYDQNLPGATPQSLTINLTAEVTPEPATLLLLSSGVLLLMRRRVR